MENTTCPLCRDNKTHLYLDLSHEKKGRTYLECSTCSLVFADPAGWLAPDEEKSRYETHNNDPQDMRYREFLGRLLNPLEKFLPETGKGLDFGCGPGPTISVIMKEKGYEMNNYDPFFHDDKSVFNEKYNFITCTEVIEHMYRPMVELKFMHSLLEEGDAAIGLMTEFRVTKEKFSRWYYKDDPTHVCFFSKKTFEWIAEELECDVHFSGKSVAILTNFKEQNHA